MKLGIDLGGTKIEALVLDERGQEYWRKRIATPRESYRQTLETIVSLVQEAKAVCNIDARAPVGIGTPGAQYVPEGSAQALMKNCNSTVLNGQPLQDDLQKLAACRFYLENDANCFALAEALSGQGALMEPAPQTVFGVILGTGVGGAWVIAKQLLRGPHHIAGEWGHNSLPAGALEILPAGEKNRSCYCGRQDCIETYLSGPGLIHSYQLRFKQEAGTRDILARMREGNAGALAIWESYLEQLAAALAQVVNIMDPDLIVLGGGMSQIPEIYASLSERMQPHVFSERFISPILPARLGDSAGVFGAAWLVP
jgi:fructokinase